MDKYLPLTSYFNKKNATKKNNIFFKFSLKIDENSDLIHLKKFENNPKLGYRHK